MLGELLLAAAGITLFPLMILASATVIGTRKTTCPACGKRELQVVGVRRMFVAGDSSIERMYRCRTCRADFMRQGKGPFVPKAEWDAAGVAARAQLPPARLIDR